MVFLYSHFHTLRAKLSLQNLLHYLRVDFEPYRLLLDHVRAITIRPQWPTLVGLKGVPRVIGSALCLPP